MVQIQGKPSSMTTIGKILLILLLWGKDCPEFREATCEAKSEIVHIFDVSQPAECQSLCRDTHGCGYWSLYGQICFLYGICESPSPCDSLCSGGPVLPNVSVCAEKVFFDTLLLGGETSTEDYSTSLELITNNATCIPLISRLPVARRFAQAAVLGSRIFHCGGLNGQFHHDCHSFDNLTSTPMTTVGRKRLVWSCRGTASASVQSVRTSLWQAESKHLTQG